MSDIIESKTLDDSAPDDKTVEYEIIESDRMDLVAEAVYFCRVIMDRQCGHMAEHGFAQPTELSAEEQEAYSAALTFLKAQFRAGATKLRRVVKRKDL